MANHGQQRVIAFVFRDTLMNGSILAMARRTGTSAIFDLSSTAPGTITADWIKYVPTGDALDLKISPSGLLDENLEHSLAKSCVRRIWVELHPFSLDVEQDAVIQRIIQLSKNFVVIPIISSVNTIERVITQFPEIYYLAIKGNEASGFVGNETTFSLYSYTRALLEERQDSRNVVVWGGISHPQAAAAFLAVGAKGIVFESLHWLTDLSLVNPTLKTKISNLRPNHTDLVGLHLGVPCRFFNKGNSVAVKEVKKFAGSLCGSEINDMMKMTFANRIRTEAVHPLDSEFGREQLIPLGVEAAFADSFAKHYGSRTEDAVHAFMESLNRCCETAVFKATAFQDSPVASKMGVRYPFIQGAMTWITDAPQFAAKVAEAGGLPTIALGLMDVDTLETRLMGLREVMNGKPFAVNVITLQENPYRDAHLAWIRETRPRFATIAAGEPSHAASLLAQGIDVIYVAPDEELLKLALESGVQFVVCEGNEAGGHVGQHSILTLAQTVLHLKDENPELFSGSTIIYAGGIFNRETAFMAAMMGADGIQMGTAYLTTEEIVSTGALSNLYQREILRARPGTTVITGEETGLRVRSLVTAKIESLCKLERDYGAGVLDEASVRRDIESITAGSLFIAARGLDRPGGQELDEASCLTEGQFMSGACSGALNKVRGIQQLHVELASGIMAKGLPFTGPMRMDPTTMDEQVEVRHDSSQRPERVSRAYSCGSSYPERIAITAMSLINSLGKSPSEVVEASLAMKSGITLIPPSRWDHSIHYNPRPRVPEKTYSKVGAFVHLDISRKELEISPHDFRTMTGATKLTMWLAHRVIHESGLLESDVPRDRISVLISQNSGEAAGTLEDLIIRGCSGKIVSAVKRVLNISSDTEKIIEQEVKSGRIGVDDTTLLGRLNCSAGGFICNKYGFIGPSFSVSAACATSLVALYSAMQMIRNGVIDAAVVGGGEEFLSPMHFLEFSALGALAGLSGIERSPDKMSRPFDADRDGMVLGEGGGMIVIERESIARKRGVPIRAYIVSMGASNSHLGMLESTSPTQEIAIRNSFGDAPYGPDNVDFVECHATGTRQGDKEEVLALRNLLGSGGKTVLSSFKSQIGHTLGASGINSMIRGIMAMNSAAFPATRNFEKADEDMEINGSGLLILKEPEQWTARDGQPRRMQINAFGFGGSNYVVQVEQALESTDTILVAIPEDRSKQQGGDQEAILPQGIFFFQADVGGQLHKLAVLAETEQDALENIDKNEVFKSQVALGTKRLKALARHGIHLALQQDLPQPLAFVFPGQGSHYAGMGRELYQTFPVIRQWMDRAAEIADFDLLHRLFYDREEDLQKTRWQQPALFTLECAIARYLVSLGVHPTALAGHSSGEVPALCLAGVFSFEDGFRIANMRALCMDKACDMNIDPGGMLACDAPMDVIQDLLNGVGSAFITNYNSPRQTVLGGDSSVIKTLETELEKLGFRSTHLRVSMAFHSPIMKCIHDELEEFISSIEFHAPKTPVMSNTTGRPFPEDPSEIKRIMMAHLESPVRWIQNVETLWEDYGVRLFVEVGPREILSNLISDTVDDSECIQTCFPSAEVIICKTALAQLFARGHIETKNPPRSISPPESATTSGLVQSLSGPHSIEKSHDKDFTSTVENIVQREINSFVMESFGRFVRPNIIGAIRKELDPSFAEEHLSKILNEMLSGTIDEITPEVRSQRHLPTSLSTRTRATFQSNSPGLKQDAQQRESQSDDINETIIRLIMEATGYERNEIEPDMDLRVDLSIRSSRLPVLMDALESHFDIKIELEDFIDVRTIRDISDRICVILARDSKKGPAGKKGIATPQFSVKIPAEQEVRKAGLQRLVFRESPLEARTVQPVEISPTEPVIIISARGGTGLRRNVGDIFRRDYGASSFLWTFIKKPGDPDDEGFDLRTEAGINAAEKRLGQVEAPAGLVFIIDELLDTELGDLEDISRLLKGFFALLKTFTKSPAKKFVLLINKTETQDSLGNLLSEGTLGMFLGAALEFGYVQFRSVSLDTKTGLSDAIRGALDRSLKPLQIIYRAGKVFTVEGKAKPSAVHRSGGLSLCPDDVVVFSGGGHGITYRLACALIPYGCKMVLLGRTALDEVVDFRRLLDGEIPSRATVANTINSIKPGLTAAEKDAATVKMTTALEINRNVEFLRSQGIDASYFQCDVTDPHETNAVLEDIFRIHGRIDGVIHGAGIIKDSFIRHMKAVDFSGVVDVKFLGAWNLFRGTGNKGLRFFLSLSSVVAVQGNPGQVNYAAGNRIMSALMRCLQKEHSGIKFKALMLPPIEGEGMAEDPEIRALLKRMNVGYLNLDELAEQFCRDLLVDSDKDVWVLFMRTLPELSTVRLDLNMSDLGVGTINCDTVAIQREDFPMIESVTGIDVGEGKLRANRTFTHEMDLWIEDHKPFQFLESPLFSGIMVLETFMEAAQILYPQLHVRGIRDVRFLDIIECPPNFSCLAEIDCIRIGNLGAEVLCETSFSTMQSSLSYKMVEPKQIYYKAQVILSGQSFTPEEIANGFENIDEKFDTLPVDSVSISEQYGLRSSMNGRYRVIDSLDGSQEGFIRGHMQYRQTKDFLTFPTANYQYSPYLLEALMQLTNFYMVMRNPADTRAMVPYRIKEVLFCRQCSDGENVTVEGYLRNQSEDSIIWDARGLDEDGKTVMAVKGIVFSRFSA